jgi:hypothetical protein
MKVQILIGGPASGKSTFGEIASKTGYTVWDENDWKQSGTPLLLILLSADDIKYHTLEIPKPVIADRIKQRQRKGEGFSDMGAAMGSVDTIKAGNISPGLHPEIESIIKEKSVSQDTEAVSEEEFSMSGWKYQKEEDF